MTIINLPSHVMLLDVLQGGMVYSNAVTTVSPTYANEVLNGGAAGWLRSTLLRPEVKSKVCVDADIHCQNSK